ncbi:MAG TPA: hypothetical protein VJA21_20060 [Verrucomicrobiae bacterium]
MKTTCWVSLVLTTGIFLTAATDSASAAAAFAGRFKNDELAVDFLADAGAYTGTVKLGDRTFPLSATEKSGALEGTFASGDSKFAFKATLDEDNLTFTTDGTAYKLTRQNVGRNPLARPATANPDGTKIPVPGSRTNEPSGGPASGAAWKTYRHATGLTMSYPADWQLKEHPQMLQLVPSDAASNADGPTEAYLAFAEAAEDIRSAEDPRVVQFLDGQLGQLMPFLKRTGEVEKIRAGAAPGVLATWEGTNPKGMTVRAHAFATVLKGYGVALVGLGDQTRIAAREKTLRGIFASFAAGEGQRDPQLIGTWKYWHYSTSGLGGFSTEITRFLMLRADGTCRWSSQSESGGSARGTDSLGNQTWSAGVAGVSGGADQGTWSAGNGKLYIMWRNGSLSEWNYSVAGEPGARRLMLKGGGQQQADEWLEHTR